jgi:hypothetical protein
MEIISQAFFIPNRSPVKTIDKNELCVIVKEKNKIYLKKKNNDEVIIQKETKLIWV